ncbi:hypothetical protein HY969_02970 [Candidatus Kaiserbacteria bacterium]|nr:hypothetical protein [Candidatus Kaiserbacteria bacterium]
MRISTSIYVRAAVATLVATAAVLAFYARSIEPGITFATHGVDLKIDSVAYYLGNKVLGSSWALKNLVPGVDKFWNFDDIKPGDYGCNVISLHVKNTHAWMCLDFKNLSENENGENEPEGNEDATLGADLADGTEFFGWMDDGDGKFEPPNEKAIFGTSTQAASYVFASSTTYAIADARGSMCRASTKRYVGMCWCAGDLTVQPNGTFACDPTALGNEAQTDSFTVDVLLRAEAALSKPNFQCGGYPPVTPPCPNCNGPINITVNNNGFINSTTTASSNTGGNTAGGGGTVNTGNASSSATSTNTNNTTEIGQGGSANDIRDFLRELLKRIR